MIVLVALLRRGSCVRIATESHKKAVSSEGTAFFMEIFKKDLSISGAMEKMGQRNNLRDFIFKHII